jgi:nucleoside-diphosphate-sugar epimerase
VSQTIVDRSDLNAMKLAFGGRPFDVVYDQLGFTPQDARIAAEVFDGRIQRFVFTSSMAVYDSSEEVLSERAFDPHAYPLDLTRDSYSYKEGKRQAEAYLYQYAPFPVAAVRPPFVISSDDDYTGRFAFHVGKLLNREPISLAGSADVSFVAADELAAFMNDIGTKSDYVGPINASNTGWMDTERLTRTIADLLGATPIFADAAEEKSPYCIGETLRLSNELARSIGYAFQPLENVIERLVREMKERGGQ